MRHSKKYIAVCVLSLLLCFSMTFTASRYFDNNTGAIRAVKPASGVMTGMFPEISAILAARAEAEAKAKAEAAAKASAILAEAAEKQKRPYYTVMKAGTAKYFTEDCLFINIFLTDSESSFDEDEKLAVREEVRKAAVYLEKKAADYGKQISITCDEDDLFLDYSTDLVIHTDPIEGEFDFDDEYDLYGLMSRISLLRKTEDIAAKYGAENVAYIINVNKFGRSYAIPRDFFINNTYLEGLGEFCIVFTSWNDTEGNESESTATVYAHEVLHLFGAVDLYNMEEENLTLAEEYFPDDIMLTMWDDINMCNIGELQAFLIGWIKETDEKYKALLDPSGILYQVS